MLSTTEENKQQCLLSAVTPPIFHEPTKDISGLLELTEDEVFQLRKRELRQYFLILQAYIRDPRPLPDPFAISEVPVTPPATPKVLSPFLNLPLEIREMIYMKLLSRPVSVPIRGPHPRQLQSHISLSQAFAPAILRANKQIYSEALPMFYGISTQCVHTTIDYNIWSHKVQRSEFLMSASLTAALRHFHITIHLGNEKRTSRPEKEDSDTRLAIVRKGIRKIGKWLGRGGTDVKSLTISWHEPPLTYTWEDKKAILDEMKQMRAGKVELGEINWGLKYPGKKFQFQADYVKELEWQGDKEIVAIITDK